MDTGSCTCMLVPFEVHFAFGLQFYPDHPHSSSVHQCPSCLKMGFDHLPIDCPELCPCCFKTAVNYRDLHSRKRHRCSSCGQTGHLEEICDQMCPCGEKHLRTEHVCDRCDQVGFDHARIDCPEICPCTKRWEPSCRKCRCVQSRHDDQRCAGYFPERIEHKKSQHKCPVCTKVGFDHFVLNCPLLCSCGLPHHTLRPIGEICKSPLLDI